MSVTLQGLRNNSQAGQYENELDGYNFRTNLASHNKQLKPGAF